MNENRERQKGTMKWTRTFYVVFTAVTLWALGDVAQPQATSCQVGSYDCAGELYVSNGNVGVGTTAPAQKLDVVGNMAVSGNVGIGTTAPGAKLDVGVGATQCCASQVPNISLAQASTTNNQMSWLQFHNAGESEAYLRLSGGGPAGPRSGQRRLEIGDSQGVLTGLTVTGNVGIGTTAPTEKLQVQGNVAISGRMNAGGGYTQPGAGGETLRIVRGHMDLNANITSGSGFTVSHPSTGRYIITLQTPFSGFPAVVANPTQNSGLISSAVWNFIGGTSFEIRLYVQNGSGSLPWDNSFNFIAVGPS